MLGRSLDEADRIRLTRAFGFAASWHRLDAAPGSDGVPQLARLLRQAGLALEHGASADQAMAALVCQGPAWAVSPDERGHREGTIAALLGEKVLALVRELGDPRWAFPGGGELAWPLAKERLVAALRGGEIGDDATLLVACEELVSLDALVARAREAGSERAVRDELRLVANGRPPVHANGGPPLVGDDGPPLPARIAWYRALANALPARLAHGRLAAAIRAGADEALRLVEGART